jgi:amino acid permease
MFQILALVGATGSTSICYILPGILYANLPDAPQWTIPQRHRTFAYCFALFGVLIMVLCLNLLFFGVGH